MLGGSRNVVENQWTRSYRFQSQSFDVASIWSKISSQISLISERFQSRYFRAQLSNSPLSLLLNIHFKDTEWTSLGGGGGGGESPYCYAIANQCILHFSFFINVLNVILKTTILAKTKIPLKFWIRTHIVLWNIRTMADIMNMQTRIQCQYKEIKDRSNYIQICDLKCHWECSLLTEWGFVTTTINLLFHTCSVHLNKYKD